MRKESCTPQLHSGIRVMTGNSRLVPHSDAFGMVVVVKKMSLAHLLPTIVEERPVLAVGFQQY